MADISILRNRVTALEEGRATKAEVAELAAEVAAIEVPAPADLSDVLARLAAIEAELSNPQ